MTVRRTGCVECQRAGPAAQATSQAASSSRRPTKTISARRADRAARGPPRPPAGEHEDQRQVGERPAGCRKAVPRPLIWPAIRATTSTAAGRLGLVRSTAWATPPFVSDPRDRGDRGQLAVLPGVGEVEQRPEPEQGRPVPATRQRDGDPALPPSVLFSLTCGFTWRPLTNLFRKAGSARVWAVTGVEDVPTSKSRLGGGRRLAGRPQAVRPNSGKGEPAGGEAGKPKNCRVEFAIRNDLEVYHSIEDLMERAPASTLRSFNSAKIQSGAYPAGRSQLRPQEEIPKRSSTSRAACRLKSPPTLRWRADVLEAGAGRGLGRRRPAGASPGSLRPRLAPDEENDDLEQALNERWRAIRKASAQVVFAGVTVLAVRHPLRGLRARHRRGRQVGAGTSTVTLPGAI